MMRARPTRLVALISMLCLLAAVVYVVAADVRGQGHGLGVLVVVLLVVVLSINLYNALSRRPFTLWKGRHRPPHRDIPGGVD